MNPTVRISRGKISGPLLHGEGPSFFSHIDTVLSPPFLDLGHTLDKMSLSVTTVSCLLEGVKHFIALIKQQVRYLTYFYRYKYLLLLKME